MEGVLLEVLHGEQRAEEAPTGERCLVFATEEAGAEQAVPEEVAVVVEEDERTLVAWLFLIACSQLRNGPLTTAIGVLIFLLFRFAVGGVVAAGGTTIPYQRERWNGRGAHGRR